MSLKITLAIISVIGLLAMTLFIGKTSFHANGITIERPWTALFFLLTCVFAYFNK